MYDVCCFDFGGIFLLLAVAPLVRWSSLFGSRCFPNSWLVGICCRFWPPEIHLFFLVFLGLVVFGRASFFIDLVLGAYLFLDVGA